MSLEAEHIRQLSAVLLNFSITVLTSLTSIFPFSRTRIAYLARRGFIVFFMLLHATWERLFTSESMDENAYSFDFIFRSDIEFV